MEAWILSQSKGEDCVWWLTRLPGAWPSIILVTVRCLSMCLVTFTLSQLSSGWGDGRAPPRTPHLYIIEYFLLLNIYNVLIDVLLCSLTPIRDTCPPAEHAPQLPSDPYHPPAANPLRRAGEDDPGERKGQEGKREDVNKRERE